MVYSKTENALASWFLAVQGRYKEYLCPSVLKRLLRYMQERPLPVSSFICNRLTPFHGDNTGSNPVGDAKVFNELYRFLPSAPVSRSFEPSLVRAGSRCQAAFFAGSG